MPDRKSYIDKNGDVNELDKGFFAEAVSGLPSVLDLTDRKEEVSVMLDSDVLSRLRAGGKDWRRQINALLRRALKLPN